MQLQGGDAIEVRDITEQILTRESRVRRLYRYIRAIRDCDIVINMFVTNRSVMGFFDFFKQSNIDQGMPISFESHLLHIGLVQMYTIF